jgi:hypothetical protein
LLLNGAEVHNMPVHSCQDLDGSDRGTITTLLSPVSVLGTDMGESSPLASVGKMIDQSGLDKPFVSGVTDFDAYFTTGDQPFAQAMAGNNWQSVTQFTLPVTGTVDFDYGAVYSIDRLAIWNISMKDIKIHTSATSIESVQQVGSFALPNHLNFPFSYSPDLLNLGGAHDVRFMRIEIDSVHLFSPSDMFGFAIVGEIGASAVPTSAELDGDYNGNGAVDAADYVVWRDNLDTNFDMPNDTTPGNVGSEDYDEWKSNFGPPSGGIAARKHVPEPTVWFLFAVGLCGPLAVYRRNRATSLRKAHFPNFKNAKAAA